MQLRYPTQNPFERNHIIRPQSNLQNYHANSSYTSQRFDQSQYPSSRQHYPLNIWNFRDDHNSRLNSLDYNKKSNIISEFEKQILLNNNNSSRKQYENNSNKIKYNRLQNNPFYRKNLLINRQQIQKVIQKDINNLNYHHFYQNNTNKYQYQTPKSFTSINESIKGCNYKITSSNNLQKNQWAPNDCDTNQHRIQYRDSFHYQSTKRQDDSPYRKPPLPQQQDLSRSRSKKQDSSYRGSGRQSFRRHNEFKPEIVIKGQKYYRIKVFPVNN